MLLGLINMSINELILISLFNELIKNAINEVVTKWNVRKKIWWNLGYGFKNGEYCVNYTCGQY